MREPTPRTSRLAITAGFAVALALVGAGFLAGRNAATSPKGPQSEPTPTTFVEPTPAAVVAASLSRADLLALAAYAADAFSSEGPTPAAVSAAAGRRFDLILPFGCEAADAHGSTGSMRWSFDASAEKLTVAIDPVTWPASDGDSADDDAKKVLRGFWIARPWSSATTCEGSQKLIESTAGQTLTPPNSTVGIARLAANGDEKVRAFEVVQRSASEDFDPQRGFQFRISGRLRTGSEGGPMKCLQSGGSEQRPVCLIIGTFTEVRIENPKNGNVLASWPISDDPRGSDIVNVRHPLSAPR